MSTYIPLGKAPESPEERASLIARKEQMDEYLSGLQLTQVQRRVVEFLISDKGYSENDLEVNREFTVQMTECPFNVRADIIVKVHDKRFLLVKCVMGSMESWERHSVAFGRIAGNCQIPYAVVTTGDEARLLSTSDGALVAEGLDAIPSKHEAERMGLETAEKVCPPDKAEKEKRILYAFEAIKCSNTQINAD
ncbi:MAG: type I restriction enzyme HsdR N-terminal domain-containing protein [Nitrospirae bacterium]|nr:type I restriction enzyme HsdR N-terminal domain-containing protein [Nitrospirota bacterium]